MDFSLVYLSTATARLGLLILAAAALAVPASVAATAPARAAAFDPSAAEQQLISDINIDRAQSGLPGLVINPALSRIARGAPISVCPGETVHGRSQDMIERNYFSHQIPSCGQYVWPALQAAGVQYTSAGENIGWNNYAPDQSVDQVNTAFMNSAPHRANIMGGFNQVGVGAWMAPGPWGGYSGVIMYTEIFASAPLPTGAVSGGVVLDAFGGLHAYGNRPLNLGGFTYWHGWDIARSVAVNPDGSGGYTLDGFGGVHPFGSAAPVTVSAYWPGWDIARGIATCSGGGYVLDGWGGIHNFGNSQPVPYNSYDHWPGWDIARAITVTADCQGGYVLDGWGGLHRFGNASDIPNDSHAYWSGWNIARGVVLRGDGRSGYTLDGFGGLHGFGGLPDPAGSAYWGGWDIARGVDLAADGQGGNVLDGFGGVHPFGTAPGTTMTAYWQGWDIARGASGN
jgi:uncharacterized protein YkwD